MMTICGIATVVCFWTGVYTITKKVIIPTVEAVREAVKETKEEIEKEKK